MSVDDPVNSKARLSPLFDGLCCREHIAGQVCVLADGHDHDELAFRHQDEYTDVEQIEVPIGQQDPVIVGGFVVRSAVIPVGDQEAERHYPSLIFDFTVTRGRKLQPIVLVMDEEDLDGVSRLIGNAAHGAITAARKAEGRDPRTGRRTS